MPHVTDGIKDRITGLARESRAEVIVVEVGGTVGDIEGLPFLEAIRQMRNEVGRDNVFYIHVTFLPYIGATGELKTKPTQHSVRELRGIGIQPDAILCRSDEPVDEEIKDKIAVALRRRPGEASSPCQTVPTVYEVPLLLEEEGLADLIVESLSLKATQRDMSEWRKMVEAIRAPKETLRIAVVGKYVDLRDSYISVKEALHHAGLAHGRDIDLRWIQAEDVEERGAEEFLRDAEGVVVPGGFGARGIEGMVETVRYARENMVPYLGLCLGMQVMVIEVARHVLGRAGANSTEFRRRHARPGDRPDARPVGGRRAGRHDASRRLSVPDRRRVMGGESVRAGRGAGAPSPSLRGQQQLPGGLRVSRLLPDGTLALTAGWWR